MKNRFLYGEGVRAFDMELISPERKSLNVTTGVSSPSESHMESAPNEKSIKAVFLPHNARVEARFNAVDDLPDPPVRPDIAMIEAPCLSSRAILSICEAISSSPSEPNPFLIEIKSISHKIQY